MSDSEESDWSDCPELEESDESTSSLFDPGFQGTPEKCLEHDKSKFGWNLAEYGKTVGFDILEYIKCVNFLRSKSDQKALTKDTFESLKSEWSDDKYLKPVNQGDPFLCHDWDSFVDQEETKSKVVLEFYQGKTLNLERSWIRHTKGTNHKRNGKYGPAKGCYER